MRVEKCRDSGAATADTEHSSTLTSMNNLATALRDKGKYEQADVMHRQALRL
jgi:hypothetical protein